MSDRDLSILRRSLDDAPIGLCYVDADLRFVQVNEWLAKLNGLPVEAHIGKTIREVLPHVADGVEPQFRQVLDSGDPILAGTVQAETAAHPGVQRTYEHYYYPDVGADGAVIGVSCVVLDVTERTEAGETFRLAVEASPTAMVMIDEASDIVMVNAQTETLFGYDRTELIGRGLDLLIPKRQQPDHASYVSEFLRDPVARRMGEERDLTAVRRDGTEFTVEIGLNPITTPAGSFVLAAIVDTSAVIAARRDRDARRTAEDALGESEVRFEAAFNSVTIGAVVIDDSGLVTAINPVAQRMFGYAPEEVIGNNVKMLMPEPWHAGHDGYLKSYHDTGDAKIIGVGREVRGLRKSGDEFPLHLGVGEISGGSRRMFIGSLTDLTEIRRVEGQLRHAHHMDAIGQLSGGIAHDFNNLLAVVAGNAELLKAADGLDEDGRERLEQILAAVTRGSSLTNRLLSFSRRQALSPKLADIGKLILGLDQMMRRTLGETIELTTDVLPSGWSSIVDGPEFENALLNLALNARDSMSDGGTLIIEARNTVLREDSLGGGWKVNPGDYVQVNVIDSGAGMSLDVLERAFEPFFTTKGVGDGSGLGLSMVYGFAKQSDGHVVLTSELGVGTTVKLFLPRSRGSGATDTASKTLTPSSGRERILVVEDEEMVLKVSTTVLRSHGYEVVEARDGKEASEQLAIGKPFDLLFTDVGLPGGMDGIQLAHEARRVQPSIAIIYTTGYVDPQLLSQRSFKRAILLRKPYRQAELLDSVRGGLDARNS